MAKKHNSHDSGYKKLFSNPELVKQLLVSFVDEDWITGIDYSTLQRVDKSFITDEFANRESDLIYKAFFKGRDVYIFILLEFQSTVDRFMALRMLRYITELYEYLVKSCKIKKLPAVFPVMLYNGEKRWTAPQELSRLIEKSIPVQYIPDFRYYKIAENEFSKEFLKSIRNSVSAIFYAENSSDDELLKEFEILTGLLKSERPEELSLFVVWFKYMFNDRDGLTEEIRGVEEAKTMLRSSIKKMSKRLIDEGIQKGIEKGIQKTAANLLKENMPVMNISRVTGLSVAEIEKLKK